MEGLITGAVELVGRVAEKEFAHLEEADVEDALVAEKEGVEGLETADGFQQVILVPLFHIARHLLHSHPEAPFRLLTLFCTLLFPFLPHHRSIGGELPWL